MDASIQQSSHHMRVSKTNSGVDEHLRSGVDSERDCVADYSASSDDERRIAGGVES